MASFKKENAKVLLGIAENRRQHLANAIDVSMGLAATLCFGIISFFFKAFIDNTGALNSSKTDAQTYAFSYVIFGFGLSSLILTIWRNYAQYLDQKIAQLYPEILDYEIQLGVSQNAGLRGILSDS